MAAVRSTTSPARKVPGVLPRAPTSCTHIGAPSSGVTQKPVDVGTRISGSRIRVEGGDEPGLGEPFPEEHSNAAPFGSQLEVDVGDAEGAPRARRRRCRGASLARTLVESSRPTGPAPTV